MKLNLGIQTPDRLGTECHHQIQSVLDQFSDMELQVWSSWAYMMRTPLSHKCTSSPTRYRQNLNGQHTTNSFLLYSLTSSSQNSQSLYLITSSTYLHTSLLDCNGWFCGSWLGWTGDFAGWQQPAHVDFKSPQRTVWASGDRTLYAHWTTWVKYICTHRISTKC